MNVIKLITESINIRLNSNSFRNNTDHCQFVSLASTNHILITFHLRAYCSITLIAFNVQFKTPLVHLQYMHMHCTCVYTCFFKWQATNLSTRWSHSSTFLKASTSTVSFQIWRIIVIELHKQPAEEVRFAVTSRRFSSKNKESGKGDCDRSSVAYWNKSPTWMIYLFPPPLWSREMLSPQLPLFELRWRSTWGGQRHARQWGCEALVPIFSLCRETVHTKVEREYSGSGLRRSCVGLSELEQSAWDIFETQMHFVTEEKNRWEVMATHEN